MKLTKKAVYEMMKADYTLFYSPMPEEVKKLFPVITTKNLESMGFHFTTDHNGKMIGMISLSTTCKCNGACQKRIVKSFTDLEIDLSDKKSARKALKDYLKKNPYSTSVCICSLCFSDSQQDSQRTMQIPLNRNFEILNNGVIHSDWLPILNCLYFRCESFGDYASVNSAVNMMNLAKKNPLVNVTTWTKNPIFFGKAFDAGYEKPENFKIVLSSPFINKVATVPAKYAWFIDAVFTVFTEEFAKLNNVTINCGARACLACLRCYANYDGNIKYVNELLK